MRRTPQNDLRRHLRAYFALAASVALLTGCASLGDDAPAHFDLTGSWDLDPAASDQLPTRHAAAGGRATPRARRGRPGAGRAPGGAPPGERFGEDGLLRADRFRVMQDEIGLTFTFADHPDQDVRIGEQQRLHGDVEAGWTREGVLEVRTERGEIETVRRFLLTEDGRRLSVETTLEPPRGREIVIVRVFERRVDDGAGGEALSD